MGLCGGWRRRWGSGDSQGNLDSRRRSVSPSRNDAVAGAPPSRRLTARVVREGIHTATIRSPCSETLVQRKMRASFPFGRGEPPGRRRSECIVQAYPSIKRIKNFRKAVNFPCRAGAPSVFTRPRCAGWRDELRRTEANSTWFRVARMSEIRARDWLWRGSVLLFECQTSFQSGRINCRAG